jgi:hypothetical protein
MPFGVLYDKFKKIFDIVFGRMGRRSVQFLKNRGDFEIVAMEVRRDPINSNIKKLIDIITFGKLSQQTKKMGFDQLFHLYLVITLENGQIFRLEKNETVQLGNPVDKPKTDTEIKPVNLNKYITVNQLIENTIKEVGVDRFSVYDPFTTNCQRWIMDVLNSNGLNNEELTKFIYQDISDIIDDIPQFSKDIAKDITDTASILRRGLEFLGFKKGGRVVRKKFNNSYRKKIFR